MASLHHHDDGGGAACWYEVRIPKTPGYQKVAESFIADYTRARAEAHLPGDGLRHRQDGQADHYFLPPDAAARYFRCEHPSALAHWLEAIRLAQPCPAEPDLETLTPLEPPGTT